MPVKNIVSTEQPAELQAPGSVSLRTHSFRVPLLTARIASNEFSLQCCQPAISHMLDNTFLKTEHPMGTTDAGGGQPRGRISPTY